MAPHRKRIGNAIFNEVLVNPVRNIFKNFFPEEGSSFSAEDINLQSAPVPSVNPKTIPKILEEDQVLEDEEVQGELPEADEVQDQVLEDEEVQGELPEADEVQDLEHLDFELLQDGDLPNAVIYKSTKLFFDEGIKQWVAEPHVRVWSNRPCAVA